MTVTAESWLEDHGSALYRYALLHLRDSQAAEEVVQETLVAALQASHRYEGIATVRTWLIGILKHKVMDHFRRQAREVQLEDYDDLSEPDEDDDNNSAFMANGQWRSAPADWGNPEQTFENREFMEILQRCIEGLPKRLAHLFMLREVMEEDTGKICQEMSITPTNLWTMLYRARMGLRQCLDKEWGQTSPGEK